MWNDLSEYIISNYDHAPKIVEVGVGSFPEVALKLSEQLKGDVVMTDIKPSHEGVIQDNICLPNLKIYEGASLIYSIRPPEELHQCLVDIAERTGADLIIKPLSTDYIDSKKDYKDSKKKFKLMNYKKTFFYRMRIK